MDCINQFSRLCFLLVFFLVGMQQQFFAFTLYDSEAWYIRDVILGRIRPQKKEDMISDIAVWVANGAQTGTYLSKVAFQAEHVKDLMRETNYPPFNVDEVVQIFGKWALDRDKSLINFRSEIFTSAVSGSKGSRPLIPWIDLAIAVTP